MLKRVLLDVTRHEIFFKALQKALPDLANLDNKKGAGRKRGRTEEMTIQTSQGDAMWHLNDPINAYSGAEIFIIQKNGKVVSRSYTYGVFLGAIKEILRDTILLQQIARGGTWHLQIPTFLYCILCQTHPSFREVTKIDVNMAHILSVGRYMYLQDWKTQNTTGGVDSTLETINATTSTKVPIHLSGLPVVVLKMVFWTLVSKKVPQNQALRYVGMLERTLDDPTWWNSLPLMESIKKDKEIVQQSINKLLDPEDEEIKRWSCFFKDLPGILETFHGKPKRSKKTKSRLGETNSKNLSLQVARDKLVKDSLWGSLTKLDYFSANSVTPISAVLFTEPDITTDRIQQSMMLLFEEWGKVWATPFDIQSILGRFMVTRTSEGVLLFLPLLWVKEIQERLLLHLCLHPTFKRRYPVPVAPWLSERYFSRSGRDIEMVIRTFYKLIHMHTREGKHSCFATQEEPELFWVYEHLHEILNHFSSTEEIANEFKNVFDDSENLYFQKKKTKKRQEVDMLVGIKNMPCLHRALKSVLEIKEPHFLDQEGFDVLARRKLEGTDGLPLAPGELTRDEMLAIYRLCATNRLDNRDALTLFFYTYVNGEILFTAKLSGVENWHRVAPFLRQYNEKMLKTIELRVNKDDRVDKPPCLALFTCFKIAEEMAHYPFQVSLKEYQEGKFNFRGNVPNSPLYCDPRDFVVRECRCPLMLQAENTKGEPKSWFPEDIFPVYDGTVHDSVLNAARPAFANHIANSPWRDLRPFEDAHPQLLEYLVT